MLSGAALVFFLIFLNCPKLLSTILGPLAAGEEVEVSSFGV